MRRGFSLRTATKIRMLAETAFTISPVCVFNYAKYRVLRPQLEINLSRCGFVSCSIMVNRRCNLKCLWCVNEPLPEGMAWKDFDMNHESMKRLLSHPAIRSCLYIGLTGGEPLLNEHIADIIRLVRRSGHMVGIVTNGILLKERISELKRSGVNQVSVSVYHTNIDRLADILPDANRVLPARTSTIIQRSELEKHPEDIEEIIRLSCESGCRGTVLTFLFPKGGKQDEVVYDDNQIYWDFKRRVTELFPDYRLYWPTPLIRTLTPENKRCRMPWFFLIVDAKGNLGLCCNHPPDPVGKYGNLFGDTSDKVFNLSQTRLLRNGILSDVPDVPDECRDCFIMGDKWLSNV